MAHFSAHRNDPLLQELNSHEQELNGWLNSSAENAILFVEDPVRALRTANIGLTEESLGELESTMNSILKKLGSA